MPRQSRHELVIRDRLNEIEADLAGKRQIIKALEIEKAVLQDVLNEAEGKEEGDG